MMSAFICSLYIWQPTKFKNQRIRGRTEGTTEDREVWYQERPMLGPDRPERGKANLQ